MAWQSVVAKVELQTGVFVALDGWQREDGLSLFRDQDDMWAVLPKTCSKYPSDLIPLNYGPVDTLGMILDMVDKQYPRASELTKMELLLGGK